jgi:hypothetical protein
MSQNQQHSGADAPGKFLETREERIKLLRSGFTGNQVEALFFVLNRYEAVGVAWDEAAMKCEVAQSPSTIRIPPHMQAASSQKASA